jgi:protease IV
MAQEETRPAVVATSGSPAAPPPQIIIQQSSTVFGRFGKWLLAALVIAVVIIISLYNSYQSYFTPTDMPREKYHSLAQFATKKIAIVEVSGAIMEGEDSFAEKQIERVRKDPEVVGVVVRVNSPGGTVTGSDFIYHRLRDLAEKRKLPIVVSMGSVCASGGYYVAMAVGNQPNSIFAEPTTWTGSIGVIIPHFDVSGGLTKLGISEDSIASGPLKKMGTPTRKMTDAERKIMQTLVDDSFKEFKAIIVSGRPKFKDNPSGLDEVATGQIFTAKQALSHGLVDQIGFVDAAIARVTELAGENADSVRCVKYEKRPTLFGSMLGTESRVPARGMADLSALLDLATPRAYYLWSWLPAALSNSQ